MTKSELFGFDRFSYLGFLCSSWVLKVWFVSTIAKWLAGKTFPLLCVKWCV